jgi:hypothetical protein
MNFARSHARRSALYTSFLVFDLVRKFKIVVNVTWSPNL